MDWREINEGLWCGVCLDILKGNTCLENGSYLMNYVGCANCHQRDFVMINSKTTVDEDGEEIVTYTREY